MLEFQVGIASKQQPARNLCAREHQAALSSAGMGTATMKKQMIMYVKKKWKQFCNLPLNCPDMIVKCALIDPETMIEEAITRAKRKLNAWEGKDKAKKIEQGVQNECPRVPQERLRQMPKKITEQI